MQRPAFSQMYSEEMDLDQEMFMTYEDEDIFDKIS